jgi:uncharacterized protein (DUF924 family)
MDSHDILKLWFQEFKPNQWFEASNELDPLIKNKFSETLRLAA